jgi:hypothetical protein
MTWQTKVAKSAWGKATEAYKSWKRSRRIKTGERGPTITGVKPMSGKIPSYVGAGGKDPDKRAEIVKTHFALKRSEKINKAEQKVKEGKAELKKMVDTGQAEEYKNLPGQHKRKGFYK